MNTLLLAIHAALVADDRRCQIVPDPDAVPEALAPPFHTLADGGTDSDREGLHETTERLTVLLTTFYPATRVDTAIQGDAARAGLAACHKGAIDLLTDNLLSLADYEDAWPGPDSPAKAWGTPEAPEWIRKQQTLVYERNATT